LKIRKCLLALIAVLVFFKAFSQQSPQIVSNQSKAVNQSSVSDSSKQKDLIDIIQKIFDNTVSPEKRKTPKKAIFSVIPYAGYTLSTGFTADISGNVGFYTSTSHQENLSIFAADVGYDSKSQKTFLTRSEIWANNNSYKIVTDLRWQRYPTDTYGLGTFASFANDIDFNYIRVYETVLKKISNDYYAGIGYNLDYHYNITATGNPGNSISDFEKYGQSSSSRSSGINLDFLYDNRKNPLNPLSGTFASVIFRDNMVFLGSNTNWQSIQFDFREYIKLSSNSNNVLALWSIAVFTAGDVPYLDLPATGSDMYNNSGRGYAIGRFRGRNELYLEGEYRFDLTKNGLFGAVVFVNGQSFPGLQNNTFERVAPAAGTGLRIKLNKHSNSNICIDYGVGTGGSRGFFVNLGEVF
jgi:hypothetical protein